MQTTQPNHPMKTTFNIRQASLLLLMVLVCGLVVELTNLQSLFFQFMKIYRPEWRDISNNASAAFFSVGLLAAIVTYGLRNDKKISWTLAFMTMLISLFVYRQIAAFDFDNLVLQHNHVVVLILAIVFPFLVAYTTHQLYEDQCNEPTEQEKMKHTLMTEIQVKHYRNQARRLLAKEKTLELKEETKPQKDLKNQETTVTETVTGTKAESETPVTPVLKPTLVDDMMTMMSGGKK